MVLAGGMLLIWVIQTNGLTEAALAKIQSTILADLVSCDLCLGVWVYAGLGFIWFITNHGALLTYRLPGFIDWLFFSITTAFIAHLLRYGFSRKFGYTEI